MNNYSLGIVLGHATQIDGPLFRQLSANPQIDLTVYYTTYNGEVAFDAEMKLHPHWDNEVTSGYRYRTRMAGIVNGFSFARDIINAGHDLIVISGYCPLYHLIIAIYARLKSVAVGLRTDTTFLYQTKRTVKSTIKDMFMKYLLKLYFSCHPTGTLAADYLLQYKFPKNRLFRFPYAVDNHNLSNRCIRYRSHRKLLRRAFGIKPDSFVVLGITKFVEREDPVTILLAFSSLSKQFANSHLILVGAGALTEKITTIIAERGNSNVHLPGFVKYSRLPMFYSISDVFVHPPRRECWGVSVNEAMACGLPVITASSVGSHVDLIKPGETGFVFETSNPDSLAKYLIELNCNHNQRKTMGKSAQELIENWDFGCIESSLLEALKTTRK